MSKRKYVKRSDYWQKFNKSEPQDLRDFVDSSMVGPSILVTAKAWKLSGKLWWRSARGATGKKVGGVLFPFLRKE